MTAHTTVQKGKRVIVVLQTGATFIGKFVEKKGSWVYIDAERPLKPHMRFWAGRIKSMSILKGEYEVRG